MGFERVRAFVLCVLCMCESSSFMPVERQWAADHCQSGTELRAHGVSVSERQRACVFMVER